MLKTQCFTQKTVHIGRSHNINIQVGNIEFSCMHLHSNYIKYF